MCRTGVILCDLTHNPNLFYWYKWFYHSILTTVLCVYLLFYVAGELHAGKSRGWEGIHVQSDRGVLGQDSRYVQVPRCPEYHSEPNRCVLWYGRGYHSTLLTPSVLPTANPWTDDRIVWNKPHHTTCLVL